MTSYFLPFLFLAAPQTPGRDQFCGKYKNIIPDGKSDSLGKDNIEKSFCPEHS